MQALERVRYALVAQLDRVTDYESVGRGFESLPAYQKSRYPFGYLLFAFVAEGTRKIQSQYAGGSLVDASSMASKLYNLQSKIGRAPSSANYKAIYL